MRLSLCIPVYNRDVSKLVQSLVRQVAKQKFDCEILVYDDGSDDQEVKNSNADLAELPGVRYHELENNIGRAAIRNRLARDSKGSHLLFLDDDCLIEDDDFLKNYWRQSAQPVVCGGRVYPAESPDQEHMLHWLYGTRIESSGARERSKDSRQGFHSNNFMIQKPVFEEFQFDESLRQYGHEDTLFGFELNKANVGIQHIDNPVLHGRLESNSEFIAKSRQAIENLVSLYQHRTDEFRQYVKLLRVYRRVKDWKMTSFLAAQYDRKKNIWEENLKSAQPSLRILNWYKLGYFCKLMRKG